MSFKIASPRSFQRSECWYAIEDFHRLRGIVIKCVFCDHTYNELRLNTTGDSSFYNHPVTDCKFSNHEIYLRYHQDKNLVYIQQI